MSRAGRFETRFDLVLLVGCAFLGFFVRALPAHVRDPLASTIRRTVLAPLVSLQRSAELTRGALDTYDSRTVALDSLALQAMEARSLAAENDALRGLLALGPRLRWGWIPAEALSGASATSEFTLTLTVGSNAGVRPRSAVVAPEGLVGMVQTVDPSMSIAIIWPHPDFRVSVMDEEGNAFGIAQAHLGRGPERYLLEMRGVAYRSEIAPGTLILSSGLGGVYPRGIPVGTVLHELETPEGWTRTYLLLPSVRPQDVRSVVVIDPQRASEGVQQVWARQSSRDSVTRRIVAANDSIARRQAALAEAARRQAETDSAAAATPQTVAPQPAQGAGESPSPAPPPGRAAGQPVRTPEARPAAAPPSDTGPRPDTARRDTARPDTSRRDTVPPGTTPPDTTRRDTLRPDTTRLVPRPPVPPEKPVVPQEPA
ncbi:MAG TPA: rod shape-determining protein MreC [Gemmatimonadaceae bacterium]|nr:rod shape-determining protein MreC [Gemmatimonadaceae bacterium]